MVTDADIERYEGLIFKTAARVAPYVEIDFEDVQQELRIKVWKALDSYDPLLARQPEHQYVFLCVWNAKVDLFKKKRRGELMIEDVASDVPGSDASVTDERRRDRFDGRYLALSEEAAYADARDDRLVLPATLTPRERDVLVRLYCDFRQPNASEVARELGLTRSQIETTVASLREKLADWRPATDEAEVVVLPRPSELLPVAA